MRHALFPAEDTLGARLRTVAYFTVFLSTLVYSLLSFPWVKLFNKRSPLLVIAPLYSAAALLMTWRLILIFFVEYTADDPSLNLFVEAYVLVADEAPGWWWSCTLLTWVTVACPMAHVEAIRRGLPARTALAYVVLAFLGAVSLAFPLLLTHLLVLPPVPAARNRRRAPSSGSNRWLWPACTAAALRVCVW